MARLALLATVAAAALLGTSEPGHADTRKEYSIAQGDRLNIIVFQEPELSAEGAMLDASGLLLLPLAGEVAAQGLSPRELAGEIAARLTAYINEPKVSVIVSYSAAQKVTVEGAVNSPGVYELRGKTTLLEALALAKGPSRVAALDNVAIFRKQEGRPAAAMFDIRKIRKGRAVDPEIAPSDVVVVGLSNIKSLWRDAVAALPALAIFRPLAD